MSKYIFNNDTDILEFLEQLRENSIQIWGEGEKIRYRSKNRQLAPETLRILKMAKGQILDFFRMIEKNVIPLTSIQTAYVVGQVQNVRFDRIECDFSFIETQRLYQKIKNYHFTPAAVISTIFMKTLAQYSETPGLSINVTGEILAITANAIFEMPRKDGIYTMASYLEKYQVLDELKKIDKFKSEGKI